MKINSQNTDKKTMVQCNFCEQFKIKTEIYLENLKFNLNCISSPGYGNTYNKNLQKKIQESTKNTYQTFKKSLS